jgi:hypothetical protein
MNDPLLISHLQNIKKKNTDFHNYGGRVLEKKWKCSFYKLVKRQHFKILLIYSIWIVTFEILKKMQKNKKRFLWLGHFIRASPAQKQSQSLSSTIQNIERFSSLNLQTSRNYFFGKTIPEFLSAINKVQNRKTHEHKILSLNKPKTKPLSS